MNASSAGSNTQLLPNSILEQIRKDTMEWEKAQQERQEILQQIRQQQEAAQRRQDRQTHSIRFFLQEYGFRKDVHQFLPSKMLYQLYDGWCAQENIFPDTMRSFCLELKKNAAEYGVKPAKTIWQGTSTRGFRGLSIPPSC